MKIFCNILLWNEKGATAVYAAVVLAMLLGFAALGVDVNYLYGVRNELHNAADGGALAGARKLFDDTTGVLTRDAAIAEATRIATANKTGNEAVVAGTVETGHWSFATKTFTANPATTQTEWEERPSSELDLDPAFINAVRVRADRSDTPSFFAKILGFDDFFVSADAVAYRGFAGTLYPAELDQPIAICKESITDPDDESYSCNMGRMLNSGGNPATANTGGWTNFTQPCQTASTPTLRPLICAEGNLNELQFGEGIGATNGVQDTTLSDLYDCWEATTDKIRNWNITLPVIECPDTSVSNCPKLVGAVNVNVLWIVHGNDPHYNDVPREMRIADDDGALIPDGPWAVNPWTCAETETETETDRFNCWKNFVNNFHLANVNGPPQTDADYEEMYQKKNIFFLPDCEVHEPAGGSGGANFGILAKIPKLVE